MDEHEHDNGFESLEVAVLRRGKGPLEVTVLAAYCPLCEQLVDYCETEAVGA